VNLATLALRGVRFHWRAHLGVLLGATLGTAILVGALAVGDSVRHSLRSIALSRIGEVRVALNGKGRFFREALGPQLAGALGAPVAPVILLRGTAAAGDTDGRAGKVDVVGVGPGFWQLGGSERRFRPGEEGVVLNQRLALRLGVAPGAEVVLRVDKPSLLSRDAPLSTTDGSAVALRLPVLAVVDEREFGRFSLEANQVPPLTAFVPLALLQQRLEVPGRANGLLIGADGKGGPTVEAAGNALLKHWSLADASLELRELGLPPEVELRTDRVFLDPPVAAAARGGAMGERARGVLSYFVNELRVGERAAPYSLVSAMEGGPVPPGMRDDEILLNQWQADDLGARPGDLLLLKYFVVGPKRRLIEQVTEFRVRAVLPMAVAGADRNLMPAFPGVADSENCRDWKPGIPIDLQRIRDKDEAYWDAYRGAPKAFITLKAGQKIWDNRFGNLTAVRYPTGPGAVAGLELCIKQAVSPGSIGLVFQPVREQALLASSQSLDFGQLFIGFSFFLIVAALLLTALLFALGVEQRSEEVGTLLALGFPPRRVQRLLLAEGAALAAVAAVLGAGAGVWYTRGVVHGLSTVWSGAVTQSALRYHAEPATLIGGAAAGFLTALLSIWIVTRRQAHAPARELLAAGADSGSRVLGSPGKRGAGLPTAGFCLLAAAALSVLALGADHTAAAGYFFGAGALLLIGGLAACRALLGRIETEVAARRLTIGGLGVRNSVRRRARSLSAIALLACGSFLVIAVGANRHDAAAGAEKRSSGTGGYVLYAESTLPVYKDLNTQDGLDEFGLGKDELEGVHFTALRLREGDEASCLNLNRAQAPRVLGVDPAALREAGAFTFGGAIRPVKGAEAWSLLDDPAAPDTVPAIGDANTVMWGLGKKVGDTLPYVDDRGNTFNLRIVATVAGSILQGSLIISERHFTERFPSQAGYQVFLIDAPRERGGETAALLNRALEDIGMDAVPAPERLAAFNEVENTYLSIFAVLGGLGLLLGSVGLGIVVLRNVLERRGELALLRAVGFTGGRLRWLVFTEHGLLLALGLLVGVAAALVAVLPALAAPGADVPWASLAVILLAVAGSGFLWVWLAAGASLRGPLMQALRNE
jgi:putative ABC transport system permease protein